jgi:hypothetical protein
VWRGDAEAEHAGIASNERLRPVFEALSRLGCQAEPVVYRDEVAASVRERLLHVDGVLVWVDPIGGGEDRTELDEILREVATAGVWVSAHPDVIAAIGTKEVLLRTRSLGWGTATASYGGVAEFTREFPPRLGRDRVRVLKPRRGNGGLGVWRVELLDDGEPEPRSAVLVHHAMNRHPVGEELRLDEFMRRCEPYFLDGCVVDQQFQSRVGEGLVRVYLVTDQVIGFSRQGAESMTSTGSATDRVMGLPSPKTMFSPDEPRYQALRHKVESEWVPGMQRLVGVETSRLPVLWDADFLLGPRTPAGEDTYVLCEINASCITPFPPEAPEALSRAAVERLEEFLGPASVGGRARLD